MNKLLIGLLLLAAAGGAFFLLKKKKEQPVANAFNQEWIYGKWNPESIQPVKDAAQPAFRYEFLKDGIALRSVADSIKADTIRYAWQKKGELLVKENAADTAGTVFIIAKLTPDSLQLQTTDSATILFTKLK